MSRKELILMLANEHNKLIVKLLHDFPTILRDLWMMEDYEEATLQYGKQKIRARKQRARELVQERYGIGINTFYEVQKRVEWVLERV